MHSEQFCCVMANTYRGEVDQMNPEFSLGAVVNRTFAIYMKNFVAFTLISFGVLLPCPNRADP